MSKNKTHNVIIIYLIVKCVPLSDQWECEYDRTPICVTNDYSNYDAEHYEVYAIYKDGRIKLFRECEWQKEVNNDN